MEHDGSDSHHPQKMEKLKMETTKVSPFATEEVKDAIDAYVVADLNEKEAKKRKTAVRGVIDQAIADEGVSGTALFAGNNHTIQIVEKHSYVFDQTKCNDSNVFWDMFRRGRFDEVSLKHTLEIPDVELKQAVEALQAAGLNNLASEIKSTWKFNAEAKDVRKLTESVSDKINLTEYIIDTKTMQVSAKK